jgi:hypothetical protein
LVLLMLVLVELLLLLLWEPAHLPHLISILLRLNRRHLSHRPRLHWVYRSTPQSQPCGL